MAFADKRSGAEHITPETWCMEAHHCTLHLCSTDRHNTAVTVKVLESTMLRVKTDHVDTVSSLETTSPIATWLFDNDSTTGYDFDDVIENIRNLVLLLQVVKTLSRESYDRLIERSMAEKGDPL